MTTDKMTVALPLYISLQIRVQCINFIAVVIFVVSAIKSTVIFFSKYLYNNIDFNAIWDIVACTTVTVHIWTFY